MKNLFSRPVFLQVSIFLCSILTIGSTGCSSSRRLVEDTESSKASNIELQYEVKDGINRIGISTSDPVMLRTFIMQGFTLEVAGERDFDIRIPSAKEVESLISRHPGEVKATVKGDREKRPDIGPVIEALNKAGALLILPVQKSPVVTPFKVKIDKESGTLSYSVELPRKYSINMPGSVKLVSSRAIMNDEFSDNNFSKGYTPKQPQPFGVGQPSRPNDSQKEVSVIFRLK